MVERARQAEGPEAFDELRQAAHAHEASTRWLLGIIYATAR